LDVIGPINPKSDKGHSYIITTNDYFTKWPEAIALKEANTEHLIQFLQGNILSGFGVLEKFITDNGSIFINSKFTSSCGKFGIVMGQSSNYYPQRNGLAKSTNKYLVHILKKIVSTNQRDWHKKCMSALWDKKLTPKSSGGHSPFSLVYGKCARLRVHLHLNALGIAIRI
jgi:hypothetical protein